MWNRVIGYRESSVYSLMTRHVFLFVQLWRYMFGGWEPRAAVIWVLIPVPESIDNREAYVDCPRWLDRLQRTANGFVL